MYVIIVLTYLVLFVFSLICMVIHIIGFLDPGEPFAHQLLFCGTFFAFCLISVFGCIAMVLGFRTPMLLEVLTGCCGSLLFISSSILSMKNAEEDEHLQYLSDIEEFEHPFFYRNKNQSIFALITGVFYLLHTTFAVDFLLIRGNEGDERISRFSGLSDTEADQAAHEPIHLRILLPKKWFQACQERSPCCGAFVDCKWLERKSSHTIAENV